MVTAPDPFADDAQHRPPAPKRRRRPWWRWNIVTLALALFSVVWFRHFIGFGAVTTWMCVITIFALWGMGPALFVPTFATTLRDTPGGAGGELDRPHGWWRRNGALVFVRGLMLVFIVLSLMHLAQTIFWSFSYMNMGSTARALLGWGFNPLLELFASTTLFLLTEIALRLDCDYQRR